MSGREQITAKRKRFGEGSRNSAIKSSKTHFFRSINSPIDRILHLQRTVGNQAVQRLFNFGTFQTKIKVGQPNDKYEQEADRVAEQVMSKPKSSIQPTPT